MKTYYVAEVENIGSFRKSEKFEAKNLSDAKRKASRMQAFHGTILELAYEVNSQGFILNPIARKVGGKWEDFAPSCFENDEF